MRMYWKYFKYILEHKKNVFIECWKDGLYLHAFTHDLSKFNPIEFVPYTKWFYGKYGTSLGRCPVESHLHYKEYTLCKFNFDKAWQHHKDNNKHHWNYWHERGMDMPKKYRKQMICDWKGMSRKFGDTPQSYYLKNYNNIKLKNNDRCSLEFELGLSDTVMLIFSKPLIDTEHFDSSKIKYGVEN